MQMPLPVFVVNDEMKVIRANEHATIEFLTDLGIHEGAIVDLSLSRWLSSLSTELNGNFKFRRGSFECLLHGQRVDAEYTLTAMGIVSSKEFKNSLFSGSHNQILTDNAQYNFFEFILDNLPADLAVFDKFHRYLYINPKGVADPEVREFLIGRDDFDYCRLRKIDTGIAALRRARFEECVDFRKNVYWEDSVRGKGADTRYVLRAFSPVLDKQGEVLYVIGYGVDVTDQKQSEILANEASQRLDLLRRFMQHISDSMIVAEVSGEIAYYNLAAAGQYGLSEVFKRCHVGDMDERLRLENLWQLYIDRLKKWGETRNEFLVFHHKKQVYVKTEQISRFERVGEKDYIITISRDITKRKLAEEALLRKNQLQSIIMDIASAFINVALENVPSTVHDALSELTAFLRADRGFIYSIDEGKNECSNIFEYCSPGIIPRMDQMQRVPTSFLREYKDRLFEGQHIVLTESEITANPTVREVLFTAGVHGMYVLPMMRQNQCVGFLGFETSRNGHLVTVEDFDLFNILSVMTLNLLSRIEFIRQIDKSAKAIAALNDDLEHQVEQKTSVNLELSKTLASQEKFALLGEIASGIAHDLNTPLSAIKVGGENIRYVLERLFKDVILECSADQITFACERAMQGKTVPMMGGAQQRHETAKIVELLEQKYSFDHATAKRLSSLMFSAALDFNDGNSIDQILQSENPERFLELISLLQALRVFTDTIMSSSERAAKVVMNLRQFIRGSNSNHIERVDLRNCIDTVLNIFNHELKYKASLKVDIPDAVVVNGYENRLFQLWSNLIKNALESLDSVESSVLSKKLIWIRVEQKENEVSVIVGNNGPAIPPDILERIFDKFFTTKHEKGGTGLGLSIVKGILDDHNADILVRSDQTSTEFEVIFKT